jgi:CSLREA domain-containing protein
MLAAAPARAATINVTTTADERTAGDGQCSLREAIGTVGGNGNGDCTAAESGANTIVLGAHTYPLTLAGFLISGNPTGCLSASVPDATDNSRDELSVSGTVQNLTIEGAGPGQTVIDACRLGDRALEVKSGATVTLRGLTIANGHARDGAGGSNAATFGSTGGAGNPGADGGGILNEGILTLVDSAVTASHAGDGGNGGQGGSLGGSGGLGGNGGQGGGIFSSGALTVSDTTISGNSAGKGGVGGVGTPGSTANAQSGNGGSGGSGGGGGGGGGVAVEGGTATITTSTIEGNTSGGGGTAQPGENSDTSQGFGGNGGSGGSGGNGAGIASSGVSVSLQATNDTVEGNITGNGANGQIAGGGVGGEDGQPGDGGNGGYGAGLLDVHSTVQLANLTVAENSTGEGGSGGAASNTHPAGTPGSDGHGGGIYATLSSPTLQNTLLNDNRPGGDCRGSVTDDGHNLIYSPPSFEPLPPDPCSVTNFIKADPKLAPLADNGGPTRTMRLQPGSPAIDQVPTSGAGCPPADQRGVTRPGATACDIGSYEVAPPQGTTGPASEINAVAATLSATVTANAADASVHFEYGTSTSYGKSTADQHVAGVTGVLVLAQAISLTPATTYHYRVVASSIDGTTYGGDRTFVTPAKVLIEGLKINPRRVHRKHGAKVSYIDLETSTTRFVLSRCTKLVKKHCKSYKHVRSFTRHDVAGRNSFHLSVRRLARGRYLLAATPSFNGTEGATVTVTFRVILR